jgi:hypothetical protein
MSRLYSRDGLGCFGRLQRSRAFSARLVSSAITFAIAASFNALCVHFVGHAVAFDLTCFGYLAIIAKE